MNAMDRITTIHKIRALISVAEHYRNAFYMPVPLTVNECIQEEIRGAVPYFSWFDGDTKFTAFYIVKCKYNHILAKGFYTRDGKKTNLTAIKNSLKRLEKEQEQEQEKKENV